MKSKRRFIPLVFLGAIILSLIVIVPAFSASGDVRFYSQSDTSKDQDWARQGGSVALEVKDSDLDVVVKLAGDTAESVTLNNDDSFNLTNIPVADRNGDGFINRGDIAVVDSDGNPVTVDRAGADGRVDLVAAHTGTVRVSYDGAVKNDTGDTVTVRSKQEPNGIAVTLTETKANSGVFRLVIETTSGDSDADSSPPKLKVAKSDTITLRYKDADPKGTASETLTVETTAPAFAEASPAHGSAGRADPDVSFKVTDSGSGIADDDDVYVIWGIDSDQDGTIDSAGEANGGGDPIDDGFLARERISTDEDNATVYWWGLATDKAGNVGITDRSSKVDDESDPCMSDEFPRANLAGVDVDNTAEVGGCQPYSVKIDDTKPTLSSAQTGAFWDTSNKDDSDKTNTTPSKAKANMVLVTFSESLDADSVDAADFEVNDTAPVGADVYGGAKSKVFLTLGSDLSANAQPKVELVGQVEDLAGNRQTSGKVDSASDGIAPTLTVTLEGGDRPVTKGSVKVTITSNEDVGTPNVAVSEVEDSDDSSALGSASNYEAVLKAGEDNMYEATISAPSSAGLYNVYVTAPDATASNTGSKGASSGPIDVTADTSAILFEFDNDVSAPTVLPDDSTGSDNPNTFITINFANEGMEYKDFDGVDLDTHATVEVVSASLKSPGQDSMDIAADLATTDSVIYLYKASGLAKGTHEVKVKVKDQAGNEEEFTSKVKITERRAFSLKLNPGWNLVSFPGQPADSSLNAVIPADHPASSIISHGAGGWQTAIRNDDGTWIGTLTHIDATKAYWIATDSFEAISVDIPRREGGTPTLPPTIDLTAGWNLVPVLDSTGDRSHGDTVSASDYFSGVKATRVYTFDTLLGTWQTVDVANDNLMVGSGYWVYSEDDDVIAP